MPYQVLARKWRPQTFLAVMGQGHVTRTLQNALAQGRIAHAYLFSGPRGVGKTTTARLLAKALNCEQRAGAEPCTTCPACLEIQAGSAVDVIEIDGASTRGIDEIRALRENVRYAPARGQWKVYIIDEVHMLTEQAFNALLKTLEEPPPHVVFVLATTEPRRVPATIHSRCLRFEFRPVSADTISRALREIVTAERIAVAPEALARIARAAEGSLRDALSLLDAALAYATGSLTEEMVSELLGSSGSADRRAFVRALLSRDAAAALLGVDRVLREGHDPILFCRDAVEALRLALVVKLLPEPPGDVRPEDRAELQAATQSATVEEVLLALKLLTEAEAEMRRSPHPRIELELASVRIARRPVTETLEEILGRLEEAEARLRQPGLAAAPRRSAPAQGLLVETPVEAGPSPRPAQGTAAPTPPVPAPPVQERVSSPGAKDEGRLRTGWQGVVTEVSGLRPTLGTILAQGEPVEITEKRLVVALPGNGNAFHKDLVEDRANRQLIREILKRHLPEADEVTFQAPGEGSGLREHPVVQAALEAFGGRVVSVRRPRDRGEGPARREEGA